MAATTGRRGRGRPTSGQPRQARAAIVSAAVAEFAERGYDAASMRAIARRAGVDPALVHHYFDSKTDLLAAAIGAPLRPDKALDSILAGPRDEIGAGIVRFLATQLAEAKRRDRAVVLVKSAVSAAPVGMLVRAFVSRELLARLAAVAADPDPQLRAALAVSQVVGLLVTRYVLELEPLAGASVEDLVARAGPALQQYLFG